AAIAVTASGPGPLAAHFTTVAAEHDAAGNVLTRNTRIALPATPVRLPAAGTVVWPQTAARTAPRTNAPAIKVLPDFRSDLRPQIVLALQSQTDSDGRLWYRIELPMRPNGRTGWVRADAIDIKHVDRRIIIHRR